MMDLQTLDVIFGLGATHSRRLSFEPLLDLNLKHEIDIRTPFVFLILNLVKCSATKLISKRFWTLEGKLSYWAANVVSCNIN